MENKIPNEETLTVKQRSIYQFIRRFMGDANASPTLREIGTHFGLSVGSVQDQVEALRKKGFLIREAARARALRLHESLRSVPILGRVHAGPLHEALESVEGYVPVPHPEGTAGCFALRVRGDSMDRAGLMEGDLIIVRGQITAHAGDIVVARVEGDATVKYLRQSSSGPYLEPANPKYKNIPTPFEIVGVVIECRRYYHNPFPSRRRSP